MKKGNAVQFYELWDHLGESIACYGNLDNLDSTFHSNFNENFHKGKVRNVYRETDVGAVRVITSVDDPNFSTSRAAQRSCEIYLSLIPHLKQIYQGHRQRFDVIIRRFAHNLIKFQTRFKDNFLRLISDASRSRAYTEFQNEVKRRIESNTSVAAEDICQLSHRAVDLDAQIETLRGAEQAGQLSNVTGQE